MMDRPFGEQGWNAENGKDNALLLFDLGKAVSRILEPERLLDYAAGLILEFTRADGCVILVRDEDGAFKATCEKSAPGAPAPAAALNWSIAGEVVSSRSGVVTMDVPQGAPASEAGRDDSQDSSLRINSTICVPMLSGDSVTGLLYVTCDSFKKEFGAEALAVLEAFASQLAISIDNAIRFETEEDRVRAREAALGRIAANVSHTVKNYLNVFQASIASIEDDLDDREYILESVNDIRKGISSLSEYIYGTLDFVRGKSAEGAQRSITNVDEIISHCVKLSRGRLQKADIECGIETAENLPAAAMNPVDFEMVLLNLIENSADALSMKEGEKKIFVEADHAPGKKEIEVLFSDNGRGIPQETQGRIFEKLFTAGKANGTGLGLYHCRQLMNKYGGSIKLKYSQPGQGTVFLLTLRQAGGSAP